MIGAGGGYNLQTSDTTAFGDSKAQQGSGTGQHGFYLNFQTGRGNTQTPSYSATSAGDIPIWVWFVIAGAGLAVFFIMRKGRKQ